MKIYTSILVFLMFQINTNCQVKYQFEPHIGYSSIFAKSGSNDPNNIIEISKVRPPNFNVGATFYLQLNSKNYLGIKYTKTEYDYGYIASIPGDNFSGLGLSFGLLFSGYGKRILTHGIGVSFKHLIYERKKSKLNFIGSLELIKLVNNNNYDTLWWNSNERDYHPSAPTTKYFKYPAVVDYNWQPILSIGLNYIHRIKGVKHLNYVFESHVKLGFHTYFKDQTLIVKDFYTNPQGRLFYTNLNGSGYNVLFKLQYEFN